MQTINQANKPLDKQSRTGDIGNEVLKTIYERRAVRKYKDIPVSMGLIDKVLDAGRMAPSAMNKQPWKFYILTDKDLIASFSKEIAKVAAKELLKSGPVKLIKSIASALKFSSHMDFFKEPDPVFHRAPVVIFISAPKANEWATLDIGMCSQNMMLASKSLGLESCAIGFGKYVENTNLYYTLHVPLSEKIHLAIILGYGDEVPEVHPRERNNAVYIHNIK